MQLDISLTHEFYKAFFNTKRFVVLTAGRQTGKTYSAMIWMVTNLIQNPKARGLWVDTTHSNLIRYVERYLAEILRNAPQGFYTYNKLEGLVKFNNGSYLDLRSAERQENIQGFSYDFVVLNEAGIILKDESLWYNAILPMCKNAYVRIIGTPKGRNLFYTLYNSGHPDFASFTITAYQSPYWTRKNIEMIKQTLPDVVFRQEMMAEFVDDDTSVFNLKNAVVPTPDISDKLINTPPYYMGLDIAQKQDYTAMVVLSSSGYVVDVVRFNKINYSKQKEKIVEQWRKYQQCDVAVDTTGVGLALYDDLKLVIGNMTNFTFTNTIKRAVIEDLVFMLNDGRIKIPTLYEDLIKELKSYECNISKAGVITYNAPAGQHDDLVIALALANQLFKTTGIVGTIDKELLLGFNELRHKLKTYDRESLQRLQKDQRTTEQLLRDV